MSRVTNIVITTSLSEDVDYLTQQFNQYTSNGLPFNMVCVENGSLPENWYGGSKSLEAHVFIGAFNYLDLDSLIDHLKMRIKWSDPLSAQLIVKEQDDLKFNLINLFPD